MAIDRDELKKKALEAAGAEEIMEIIRAAGEEITAEEAVQFFDKVQKRKTDKELSLDELEAVSGGADRDWLTEGCANLTTTSYCWTGLDYCDLWDVTYTHEPFAYPCRYCGKDNAMYQSSDTGYTDGLTCKFCHACDNKQFLKEYWAAHPRTARQA